MVYTLSHSSNVLSTYSHLRMKTGLEYDAGRDARFQESIDTRGDRDALAFPLFFHLYGYGVVLVS